MAEYSRIAKGKFTSTGMAQVIQLPFQPDTVEMWNYTVAGAVLDSGEPSWVPWAYWDSGMGQGFAIEQVYDANDPGMLRYDTVTVNGISTFEAGQLLQYGPSYYHAVVSTADFSISKASAAVVTTVTDHGLASGDVVIFQNLYQTSTTGMQQIAGIPFTVTVLTSKTFSIPWDTSGSNYTVFNSSTSTGNVGSFKKVLYPYLYFPGVSFVSAVTLGTTTTIETTTAHNCVVGQEVAFRITNQWGTYQLNSLPNVQIPGSPIYGYVVAVTDYNTLVVNINSSSFSAFNPNQPFAGFSGEFWPQMVAVGSINTGGVQISSGSALYPPPYYMPIGTTKVNTINGPSVLGAYVNNTAQGFVIGAGTGTQVTDSILVGADGDVIYWEAKLHDMSLPS